MDKFNMSKSFIKGIESSEILKADLSKESVLVTKLINDIDLLPVKRFVPDWLCKSNVIEWAESNEILEELLTDISDSLYLSGKVYDIEVTKITGQSEDFVLKQKLITMFDLPDWAGKEEIIKAITEKLF